jgi:hypothetical protein
MPTGFPCDSRRQPERRMTVGLQAGKLLSRIKSGAMLLADRGYDASRRIPCCANIVQRGASWAINPFVAATAAVKPPVLNSFMTKNAATPRVGAIARYAKLPCRPPLF